jgi:hypothetical protein
MKKTLCSFRDKLIALLFVENEEILILIIELNLKKYERKFRFTSKKV